MLPCDTSFLLSRCDLAERKLRPCEGGCLSHAAMGADDRIPDGATVWIKNPDKKSEEAFVKATVKAFTPGRGYTISAEGKSSNRWSIRIPTRHVVQTRIFARSAAR